MKSNKATCALIGIGLFLAACGSGDGSPPSAEGAQQVPHPGEVIERSCLIPEDGCPCEQEDKLMECGRLVGVGEAGQKICEMGYRRCTDGVWSDCDTLAGQGSQPGLGVQSPVVILPGNCAIGNVCDPYCRQYGEENLHIVCPGTGRDWTVAPNGPPPPAISSLLNEAGYGSSDWYHELDPGDTAIDPISMEISLSTVDVYFLLNATNAMKTPIGGLADGIESTINSLRSKIPNIAFGLGTFVNYESWPYGEQSPTGNAMYNNMVNVSTDQTSTINKVRDMKAYPSNYFSKTPYAIGQGSIPALFAAATNLPLMGRVAFTFPNNGGDAWYNVFKYYGRASSSSSFRFTLNSDPPYWGGKSCSNGIGAPCFRPNAYHIVMLVQDAPMMNGPGGSFPYYQMKPRYFRWDLTCDYTTENSWYWYYSPSVGSANGIAVLPPNKGSTKANTLSTAVGSPQVYFGNLNASGTSNSYYHKNNDKIYSTLKSKDLDYDPSAIQKCSGNMATGNDAYYDFTVTENGTRYWFDTVGSSYDTVLYLINMDTDKVMACNDDATAYLSMGSCNFTSTAEKDAGKANSAIVGTLPAGSYRLVVDKYDSSSFPNVPNEKGIYQLNLWPNFDDPQYAGNPAGTAHSTPSYTQTLSRMKEASTSLMVGAIESSGHTCGESVAYWEKMFARWSLEGIAKDTGAIVNGKPLVYSVKQNGTTGCAPGKTCDTSLCPASGSIATVLGDAISDLTQNFSQPIEIVGVDFDDLTDFDGVSGVTAGPTVLTPSNVDDATFISTVTAKPTTGCTVDASGSFYSACLPGSSPNFDITFKIPSGVAPIVGKAQIFRFHVEMRGMNGKVLATQPVTIVVPPGGTPYDTFDVEREFRVADACAAGTHPVWLDFGWNSVTPGETYIEFFVKVADTAAGLDSAAEISIPIGTARSSPTNSQVGIANLGQFLVNNNKAITSPFMRVRAHMVPTTAASPALYGYSVTVDCLP